MADQQPIIIKKIIKGGGGHSGGAWKIAYADFVTAMMAFFLLLWLLNSVTQDQLAGLSEYFAPSTPSISTGGSDQSLSGKTLADDGAAESDSAREVVSVEITPPKEGDGGDANIETVEALVDENEEQRKEQEEEEINKAVEELEQTIASNPSLNQLKDSLLVDNTPEGLRIQLIDQDGLTLFPSGSADMFPHTEKLLEVVVKVIKDMPQDISISGHTDAVPYVTQSGYSNWELSADRANAARRALLNFEIPDERVNRIVGRAETEPLLVDDPRNPRNRRLSIVLLRGTGESNFPAPEANDLPDESHLKESDLPGLGQIRQKQIEEEQGIDSDAGNGVSIEFEPTLLTE